MSDQKVFDAILDNALNILRLAANKTGVTGARLEQLKKRLVAKLATEELNGLQRIQLGKFFKETDEIITESFKQLELDLDLPKISKSVAGSTATSIEAAIGSSALAVPTADYFKSVASNVLIQGAPSKDWWARQSQAVQFAFANQVRQGLANAETNQQIISRIVGKSGEPGVMDIARRNAATLVQTSVQAVANDARRATFDANDDIIKGLKQVSTLDGHTSIICISYSGAEWNLKREPINGNTLPFNGGCPRHFSCRSLEIPITKTFRELGVDIDEPKGTTRASDQGQISVDTSFDGFLERRGRAYQERVLGPGRADLWREGKITLRDLVNGQGRPISVSELSKINPGLGFFNRDYLAALPSKVFQPLDSWEAISKASIVGKKQLDTAMGNVAKKLGLRTDLKPDDLTGKYITSKDGFYFAGPIKKFDSAAAKVLKDYDGDWSQLNDSVRSTISVSSLSDVKLAIAAMRKEGIDFVARPKDRFLNPVEGYRDILGIIKLPNGMNAEMQFHVKGMTAAKETGHSYYNILRALERKYPGAKKPDGTWSKADILIYNDNLKKQLDIYNEAWLEILKGGE